MRCKIVRTKKLMWRNIMKSIKSKKTSVLYYSIDNGVTQFVITYMLINLNKDINELDNIATK